MSAHLQEITGKIRKRKEEKQISYLQWINHVLFCQFFLFFNHKYLCVLFMQQNSLTFFEKKKENKLVLLINFFICELYWYVIWVCTLPLFTEDNTNRKKKTIYDRIDVISHLHNKTSWFYSFPLNWCCFFLDSHFLICFFNKTCVTYGSNGIFISKCLA